MMMVSPLSLLQFMTILVADQFDLAELPPWSTVWAASPEAEFLKGKFIWSNWDVEELIAKKEELLSSHDLTLGLLGYP